MRRRPRPFDKVSRLGITSELALRSPQSLVVLTGLRSNRSFDKLSRLGIASELALRSPQSLVVLSGRHWNLSVQFRRLAAGLPDVMSRSKSTEPRSIIRRQVRLTQDEVDQLIAQYLAGATSYELAEQWHLHRHTITEHLRRAGVLRYRSLTEIQVTEACRLYLDGWSLARIAAALSCAPHTVRSALLREGVTMRRSWERP